MDWVYRAGLAAALLVVLVDLATRALFEPTRSNPQLVEVVFLGGLAANVAIYWQLGLRVGQRTKLIRSAAEAGVLAGVVVGVAAIISSELWPLPPSGDAAPVNPVGDLAFNVVIGGLVSIVAGFIGSRMVVS